MITWETLMYRSVFCLLQRRRIEYFRDNSTETTVSKSSRLDMEMPDLAGRPVLVALSFCRAGDAGQ